MTDDNMTDDNMTDYNISIPLSLYLRDMSPMFSTKTPKILKFEDIYMIDSIYETDVNTLMLLSLNDVCECVSTTIIPYFNKWIINKCPVLNNGLDSIFNLIKYKKKSINTNELDEITQNIIIKIVSAMYIDSDNKYNLYISSFIQSYFDYTYEESIILLWYIEKFNYIEHGVSLRCPYIIKNGCELVKNNSVILIQIDEWINKNHNKCILNKN